MLTCGDTRQPMTSLGKEESASGTDDNPEAVELVQTTGTPRKKRRLPRGRLFPRLSLMRGNCRTLNQNARKDYLNSAISQTRRSVFSQPRQGSVIEQP